jgi:hypothetical protein
MGSKTLHPCVKCQLPPKYLMIMRHFELERGSDLSKFFILCGCKEPLMFDSEKQAISAWNKANPVSPAKRRSLPSSKRGR